MRVSDKPKHAWKPIVFIAAPWGKGGGERGGGGGLEDLHG